MRMGDTSARGTTRQLQWGPLGWTGAGGPRRAGASGPALRASLVWAERRHPTAVGLRSCGQCRSIGPPLRPFLTQGSGRGPEGPPGDPLPSLSRPGRCRQGPWAKWWWWGGLRNKEINALRRPSQPTPRPVSAGRPRAAACPCPLPTPVQPSPGPPPPTGSWAALSSPVAPGGSPRGGLPWDSGGGRDVGTGRSRSQGKVALPSHPGPQGATVHQAQGRH